MDAFRTNGFIKVKMPKNVKINLNLLKKITFYLTTTLNMKNIKNCRSQLSVAVLKVPAQ